MSSQGLNRVVLIGSVDGEPRYRPHERGRHRLWLRVRTSELRPDENGVKRERLGWHSVVVWGGQAEGLSRFLRSGHRVAVEGRLVTRKVGDAGAPRWDTEIHARELLVLDRPASATDAAA